MNQTVRTTATKRVLNGVALATLWLAGVAGALAADPPTGPTYTNSLGMVLARFEPGTFTMGEGTDPRIRDITGGPDWDEQPAHSVTLTAPFYVLTGRVTKAQFDLAGLGTAPASGRVSWDRAAAFCDWLSQKEGRSYRLLTEAEWEYVCRNPGAVSDFDVEWVSDWHGGFRNVSLTNPAGPATGVLKVLRSDVANRRSLAPSVEGKGIFRVVMDTAPTDRFVHAPLPFNQMGVKQITAPALQGPNAAVPYFTARFAMPIPPDNDKQLNASLLGLDPAVQDHNHSPGLEIMPNGDVLAIWFTGPKGTEYGPKMRNVQARLRYGAEEFDMPELMVNVKGEQNISSLQWREGTTNWLFTGGDSTFRVSRSLDSGATWTMVSPYPTGGYTQPITSAFRAPDGAMYVATDGDGNGSCLWRSLDNGLTWSDQGGQTSGRHSTIVPLDGIGRLLSLAGKNTEINGYMPQNISTDWGKTWQAPTQSPFPKLGGNQRPSMIRLASGKLAVVGDATLVRTTTPPAGWTHGTAPYVALSADNGATWHFKALPVALKHESSTHLTLGYATVRQAPNGVIHVLTTMTHPCIHYEFNEAWVYSAAGDIQPETSGGSIQSYSENYPGGAPKATWSARICPNGRYLLHGVETHYYEDGKKQWEVTWASGRRTGEETLWAPNGDKFWSWSHNLANNVSTWTHWWSNGQKRLESQWNANPVARDLPARRFRGLVADGTAKNWDSTGRLVSSCVFANGTLTSENTVPSITFQPANVSVTAGFSATFNVTATGRVPLAYQWYRNGVAIGGATGSTYTLAATTINDRGAAFQVTVTNAYGSVTSSVAMLTVNSVVTCAIASPTNGATVTAGTTVPITVSAATSHGAITNVEFSVDGVKIGSDATAPYTCDWNPVQPAAVGTRVITAKAFDGFTSTNAVPVTVTVLSRVTCAITAPTSQTVVKAGTNVTLTAAASSLDAGINQVDFFADGVKIGTGVSPSLACVWQNVQVGTHAITAVATDGLGQSSPVSAPITISVTASGAWEPVMALGGTIKDYTLNGRKYRAHIFDTVGTTSLHVSVGGNAEVLVVAGGGGGGAGDNNGDGGGGGGGAGGLVYTNLTLVPGNYTVTVGAGGQGRMSMSGKGSNSVFGTLDALGGGGVRRGVVDLATQDDGGSGGGMFGRSDYTPGTGTQTDSASGGYGNNGGYGDTTPGNQGGGGGGGAGSVGGNAPAHGNGGNGGDGISYDLSGTLTGYAGGGGGGAKSGCTAGTATAGGGAGGVGTHGGFDAAANSGGGGGGAGTLGAAANGKGGAGGSGIVIVRYAIAPANTVTKETTNNKEKNMKRNVFDASISSATRAAPAAVAPLRIGSRRELFTDRFLIEDMKGTELRLHSPQRKETAIGFDQPWEGSHTGYVTVLADKDHPKDSPQFLMYYRGWPSWFDKDGKAIRGREVTCVALSEDGIRWIKPSLTLYEFTDQKSGSRVRTNNIVLPPDDPAASHNFTPFIDTRPGVPASERFKALTGAFKDGRPFWGYVSGDGIHWRKISKEPLLNKKHWPLRSDGASIPCFWSDSDKCYFAYFRIWIDHNKQPMAAPGAGNDEKGWRWFGRARSEDFIHWKDVEPISCGDAPVEEHLYTSEVQPYFRAPHLLLSFPCRMVYRKALSDAELDKFKVGPDNRHNVNDGAFMTSRDGLHFERTFMEAFLRPGLDRMSWSGRNNYAACGHLSTGPEELSLYYSQGLDQLTEPSRSHLVRCTLRTDGFVSVHAPYRGGELLTKPLIFEGNSLEINYATSASGEVRIEVQNGEGRPIEGFTLSQCDAIFGDQISRTVTWGGNADVSRISEKPIKLRFVLKDADLYSFRFGQ